MVQRDVGLPPNRRVLHDCLLPAGQLQSIDSLSPTASGVRSLPLILTTSVAIIILGMTVKHFGSYTTLVMAFCAAVAAVAIGLMITFDIGNSLGREVGYQLLAGFAFGFPFQLPVIHGQTQSKADDLAVVTAIIICAYIPATRLALPLPDIGSSCPYNSLRNDRRRHSPICRAMRLRQPDAGNAGCYGPGC